MGSDAVQGRLVRFQEPQGATLVFRTLQVQREDVFEFANCPPKLRCIRPDGDGVYKAKLRHRPSVGVQRYASKPSAKPAIAAGRLPRAARLILLASRKGIEPLTPGLGNLCSILLS